MGESKFCQRAFGEELRDEPFDSLPFLLECTPELRQDELDILDIDYTIEKISSEELERRIAEDNKREKKILPDDFLTSF